MVWVPDKTIVRHDPPLVSVGRTGGNVPNASNIYCGKIYQGVKWWLAGGVLPNQCVAAYQPIRAASLLASYINLANPGKYNAAPGVAPTFDASTGWTFDGSSQYLNSGAVPGNNWSYIMYTTIKNASGKSEAFFGARDVSLSLNAHYWGTVANGYFNIYYQGVQVTPIIPAKAIAVLAISKPKVYLDAEILSSSFTSDFSPAITQPIYIGQLNTGGSPIAGFYLKESVFAFAIYNTTLTDSQIDAITKAMKAL